MVMTIPTERSHDPFDIFKRERDGKTIYLAGFPFFPRNFSRDALIAGIIAGRSDLLSTQIEISAQLQGKKLDIKSGEQPGKIHHESPGVWFGHHDTTYDGCDTTALFLTACEGVILWSKPLSKEVLHTHRENIVRAVDYILGQLDDSIFWENPPAGADSYNLSVTYWKDSILPDTSGKQAPVYPVVYPLAHFMNARGILSASRILNDPDLAKIADTMFRVGIKNFIRPDGYVAYRDADGELLQSSSDELHALAYIPTEYNELLPLAHIRARATSLETPFGYMCIPKEIANRLPNKYHADRVWVFEQALINYGAKKFSLEHEADIAAAIKSHIRKGQELFAIGRSFFGSSSKLLPKGNSRQLWSVAAIEYFDGKSTLSSTAWL